LSSLGEKLVKLKRIYRNVIAQEVGEKWVSVKWIVAKVDIVDIVGQNLS
jgi:hypothetical protein